MSVNRRQFLQASGIVALHAGGVLPFTTAPGATESRRRLVVLHLGGGNDGLNTLVPFEDPRYGRLRPTLKLEGSDVLRLADGVGLHSALSPFRDLYHDGKLAIIRGVGYRGMTRSHFIDLAAWETGEPDPRLRGDSGWIGRRLDTLVGDARGIPRTDSILVGPGSAPLALQGRRSIAANLESLRAFQIDDLATRRRVARSCAVAARDQGEEPLTFLSRTSLAAYEASERFAPIGRKNPQALRPATTLDGQFNLVSHLMDAGHPARVYYLRQDGYDTHGFQANTHANLLFALGRAVAAFLERLRRAEMADDVIVMVFSEFGRTIRENGSRGTDHGSAGPVFIAGSRVRGGLYGAAPDLESLDNGEPHVTMDLTRVQREITARWLKAGEEPTRKVGFLR